MTLADLIKFTELIHEFQKVERMVYIRGEPRRENDVEHSYQLAMLAWYIADAAKLPFESAKIIQYALVHDLVEAYAGDTYLYDRDPQVHANKDRREHEAAQRLQKEFPEFHDLHALIARYHARNDEESKFVYALDKVIPVINIYLDKGRSWHVDGVTFQMILDGKKNKVSVSKEVQKFFDELVVLLKRDQATLFPEDDSGKPL